jgi:hypothetical protein
MRQSVQERIQVHFLQEMIVGVSRPGYEHVQPGLQHWASKKLGPQFFFV